MLILTTPEAIKRTVIDFGPAVPVKALRRYAEMIETEPIAWLFILQPGDRAGLLRKLRGQPFTTWEFIDRLDGWYEAVFIISDDGFGHAVLIPDTPDSDQDLLAICKANCS